MRHEDPSHRKPQLSKQRRDWRQSRWARRSYVALLVLLALGVVSRLIVMVALPPVIRKVAQHYGLAAQYERMELYLYNGDVGLWHFSLAPAEGGAPLVQSDYTRVHISTFDLLRGRLTVRRLEAEGVDLQVERTADGNIPLLQRFARSASSANPTPQPGGSPSTPRKIDLSSPLEIDAFRLTNVHAHIVDAAVTPAFDGQVELNLLLTDLDSTERPTRFEMDMTATPVLDLLHVEGTGTANGKSLDADLHVEAKGLHPLPAAAYLHALGIHPTSNYIGLAMHARLSSSVTPDDPQALSAKVRLDGMTVTADGQQAAALDQVTVNADSLSMAAARVSEILVEGGHCQMRRDSSGEMGVAGLQVIEPAVLEERLSVPLTATLALIPRSWTVGELAVRNLNVSLHDQLLTPGADVALNLNELTFNGFSPEQPDGITTIRGRLTAPGIAGSIRLDGQARPFAATKNVDLTLAIDGIRPDAMRPYLDAWGLASDYNAGSLTAAFHADVTPGPGGTLMTNAKLSKLALKNGADLVSLDSVGLSGAAFDPASGRLHVKSIEISGPQIASNRDPGGGVAALGFHTKPPLAAAPPVAPVLGNSTEPPPPATVTKYILAIPKMQIDRVVWNGIGVHYNDPSLTPNPNLAITDAGLELDDLNIDFDPNDAADQPGKLHAWLNAPNIAQSVVVDGAIHRSSHGMSADFSVDGNGVTSDAIAKYFEFCRIRPVLHEGNVHFMTHVGAVKAAGGVGATLAIDDLAYKDGAKNLVTVDHVRVGGISLRNNELNVDQVAVQSPRVWISRDADGALLAAGVSITPAPPTAPESDRLGHIYQNSQAPAVAGPNGAPMDFTSVLHEFSLQNVSVDWTDHTIQPAPSAHLTVSAELSDVVLGRPAPPAKLTATIHEDHALDRLTVNGLLTPSLQTPSAKLTIDAAGIRAGTLGAYLGPDVRMILQDGRFHTDLDAAVTRNPDGGIGARVLVSGLDYRDGADGPSLFQLDAVRLTASRIDLPGKKIALDEIGVDGVKTSATLCKDGTIRLLGVQLGGAAAPSAVATTAPAAAVRPEAQAIGIANLAKIANETHPLITLDKLDIGVSGIAVSDESRPAAAPLTLSDVRISNRSRIELLGDNPQARPPADLDVAGAITPLVGKMDVHARLSPFAETAHGIIDVNLSGIRGAGVTDLLPDLKSQIDGAALTDGRLAAHLDVRLKQPRSDPADLDLTKDFGAEFSLKGLEFTDGETGAALAGIGEVTADDIQIQPGSSSVIVRDLECAKPSATVFRDAQGIHLLGLLIKPSAWKSLAANDKPATPAAAPAATTGEIAIDKLLVSGIDVGFEDRVCDPPLLVPLNGLDMEVRGLTTRMSSEDKSCRFSALLNAAKVPLPKRGHGTSPTTATADTQPAFEQRDLFSQAEANGIVSIYPKPKGWVKASINALDLAALTGEAKQENINLGGGTFDGTIDLRMAGDGTMDLGARASLTDLELTEPDNGPITRYLKVDSPLNIVIAALQDEDGSITLPIDVPIRAGHISSGDIALAATGAVASVITTAVASTPLKATDSVLSLFGNQKLPKNEQPVTLTFSPADPSLSAENIAKLQTLLQQCQTDPTLELALHHVLGGGDAVRAAVLANPSPRDSENLAHSLRLKRSALLAAREAAAERAAAQIASGFGSDSDAAIQQVRQIDIALATTENAMDEMYDMLRPGADRQAGRRTRAACLEIGQDRLLAVRDALLASGIRGIEGQIKVAHATFNVAPGDSGGQVIIVLTHKKNQ